MGFSQEFEKISRAEASSAAARFIYNEVQDWRGSEKKPVAIKRWLWELLQNATDCANGRPFSFSVSWKPAELTICHNAGPFKMKEIVALVEGDSSKQRRSADTTGRFGKGFLVTHVISTVVRVRGVLTDKDQGRFGFTFLLSRGGSEGEIIQNIRKCAQALDDVESVDDSSCETRFIYHLSPKDESRLYIEEALGELRNHSPYLFAFIPELTSLTCEIHGQSNAIFTSLQRTKIDTQALPIVAELVPIKTPAGQRNVLSIIPTLPEGQDGHPATVAFELPNWPERPEVNTPVARPIAKIFQRLPLHGTRDLEIPVVINLPGTSEVDSDRAGPNLDDSDTRHAIEQALGLLPSVIDWARRKNMASVHRLVEFGISEADRKNPRKGEDWQHIIQPALKRMLSCRIVETSNETSEEKFLRINGDGAVFPKSAWLELQKQDLDLLRGTHQLLELRGEKVPRADSLEDWEYIIQKWKAFGDVPQPRLIGLKELFADIESAKNLTELARRHPGLKPEGKALTYVCEVFRIAAEYCQRHSIVAPADLAMAPLIPNQRGDFRSPGELSLDSAIDGVLKEISAELGIPFQERLIHPALTNSSGRKLVAELCGNRKMDSAAARSEIMTTIETRASTPQRGASADITRSAAVKLLVWLASHPEYAIGHNLKPFPLLCEDRRLRAFTDVHEAFLLPSQLLGEGEGEWARLLPDYVKLSEEYVRCCDTLAVEASTLTKFLEEKGLATASLVFERETDFDSEMVAALQPPTTAQAGHRVESLNAKDAAGLARLLSDTAGASASGSWAQAETVFRYVLGWLVPHDDSWKNTSSFECIAKQNHGCAGTVFVYPCLWLGKLKTMAWIPGGAAGGSCETLNGDTAKSLLGRMPPEVVESADVRKFLSLHCGVDGLELAIRAAAGGDPQREAELRGEWAEVVDTARPSEVVEFINRHRTASEINKRNQKLGLIVERLVKDAFYHEGFDTEWTGVGSDFRATMSQGVDPEWERQDVGRLTLNATYQGRSLTFLVEVKTTRGNSVSMSWKQGETAARESDHYVLSVVDFNGAEELFEQVLEDDEPTWALVEPCLRVIPRIGEQLSGAVRNLSTAAVTSNPGIEVEKAEEIRFRVLRQVWLGGEQLGTWARAVREKLAVGSNDAPIEGA
jgi:hypothetical protein